LESDREKIIIIAHNDIRKRADFIFSPLEISHKFMPVLLETDKYGFLNTVCYLLKNRTEYNKTVFLGGDFKNFILIILWTALKKQKIIRLGGTIKQVRKQEISACFHQRQFVAFLKLSLNYFFSICSLNMANAFIMVNKNILKEVKKYNKYVKIIPQFIQLPPLNCNENRYTAIPPCDHISILTVTNLNYKEKCRGVVELLTFLSADDFFKININIEILGGGDFKDDLIKKVSNLNLQDNIHLKIQGFVANTSYYYSKADIFLYNSKLDSTPNVILESMAHGLPLVINNYEPFKSIIDSRNAIFFHDYESFKTAFLRLCQDKKKRVKMGKYNQDYIRHYFSKERILSDIESFLERL
jgi:glycosyltransferase involved in cell wall biosynthesis